jgi:hypothetical protein
MYTKGCLRACGAHARRAWTADQPAPPCVLADSLALWDRRVEKACGSVTILGVLGQGAIGRPRNNPHHLTRRAVWARLRAGTRCSARSHFFSPNTAVQPTQAQETPLSISPDSERTPAVTPMPCISRSRTDDNDLSMFVSTCEGFGRVEDVQKTTEGIRCDA